MELSLHIRIDFSSIFIFFRHRFPHRFFHRFLMENGSQNPPKSLRCGEPFGILFVFRSEGQVLDAFWSPFGSRLAAFWLPLAAFWLTLAPFWLTFGALWLTFGALGITFAHRGARFSHFCGLLASFLIFLGFFDGNLM